MLFYLSRRSSDQIISRRGLISEKFLAQLEKEDGKVTDFKVNEVLGVVYQRGIEFTANDAVPRRIVLLVEFLLDKGGNVLLNVEELEGSG